MRMLHCDQDTAEAEDEAKAGMAMECYRSKDRPEGSSQQHRQSASLDPSAATLSIPREFMCMCMDCVVQILLKLLSSPS